MDLTERQFQEELIANSYHGAVICHALNYLDTLQHRYPELRDPIEAVLRPVDDSTVIDVDAVPEEVRTWVA